MVTAVLREYQPGLGNPLQPTGAAGETLRQICPGAEAEHEGAVRVPDGAPVALVPSLQRLLPSLIVIFSELQRIQARPSLSHSRGGYVVNPLELSFIPQEIIHLRPELITLGVSLAR